jgi:hypothetical protein
MRQHFSTVKTMTDPHANAVRILRMVADRKQGRRIMMSCERRKGGVMSFTKRKMERSGHGFTSRWEGSWLVIENEEGEEKLRVRPPSGGCSMFEVEAFINHLMKIARESGN